MKMDNKKNITTSLPFHYGWFFAAFFIIVVVMAPFFSDEYLTWVTDFITVHPQAAFIIIIIARFLGVAVAPLPGAPIALLSVALLPWRQAFLYNFIGAELGAIAGFWMARLFRERAVRYFASLERVHEWQKSISSQRQFWGFVGLRLVSITAFDFVSYAAGLSTLPFWHFFFATVLVDLPINIAFFFLGGIAVHYGIYFFLSLTFIFAVLVAVWQARRLSNDHT